MIILVLVMKMIVMLMIIHRMKSANESSDLVLNYNLGKLFHSFNFSASFKQQNCLPVRTVKHILLKLKED
jgi:hypothetical protein